MRVNSDASLWNEFIELMQEVSLLFVHLRSDVRSCA